MVDGFLEAGFHVDRTAALEALRSYGQFNAIDPDSSWKVDLLVRKRRPFSKTEFERRGAATLLGVEVSVASLEDVVRWVRRLDLDSEWKRFQPEADESGSRD